MKVSEVTDVPLDEWAAVVGEHAAQGFSYFDWLTAVDETDAAQEPGFDVVVHLMDVSAPERLSSVLLRTRVPDGAVVASLTPVFRGAAWHERETHEMFGIDFAGFDDGTGLGLRPLLLPDGFEGTPLRKSFVLPARASKPWPGGKEPGEGHGEAVKGSPARRRVQAPGVPPPEWGPR
ncbi:NADH-quinone oxidoreductase subunit C [Intrasporangium sp.]|uniref:NADH-quinone oxidoreductase subunit C n=1 Tax=Intrasporangium sp. TaxID=1925024 RepID=UPI003221F2BD